WRGTISAAPSGSTSASRPVKPRPAALRRATRYLRSCTGARRASSLCGARRSIPSTTKFRVNTGLSRRGPFIPPSPGHQTDQQRTTPSLLDPHGRPHPGAPPSSQSVPGKRPSPTLEVGPSAPSLLSRSFAVLVGSEDTEVKLGQQAVAFAGLS